MTDYVYDLEIYRNVFTGYFGNVETRKCYGFEISDRRDDRQELIELCRHIARAKGRLIGFNNCNFDYPLLHFILKNQSCTVEQIFEKAQSIIDAQDEDKAKNRIPNKEVLIPQIDLYLIHHFNNKARATSLKVLEFNMMADNIEDLPYEPGSILTPDQTDILLPYNKHDMLQTFLFWKESLDQIRFREELSKKYKRNFLNHNDTKIGKDYFVMKLEQEGVRCFDERRKPIQTVREELDLSQCVPSYVKFSRPEFQAVRDWIASQRIKETKGVFTDIIEDELGELAKYANMRKKAKKLHNPLENPEEVVPGSFIEERELKSGKTSTYHCWNIADNLNCVVDGVEYVFGTGGLHAAVDSQIVESDEKRVVKSFDVASFYPNLAIVNRIYPEHMTEKFCDIYLDIYQQRKGYAKGTAENAMMKLALNGSFGDSNNPYSPFYDPMFTMKITVGGQLSLAMLVDSLLSVPTVKILLVNTDGLEFSVDRQYEDQAKEKCSEWEKQTGLELEESTYQKLAIMDVNNYIGVDDNGKVKRKGSYVYIRPNEPGAELGWHQNHSMLVVPKAAEAAILEGKDIEDFILNHDNIYDFMLRTKVPRNSRLVGRKDGADTLLQNTTRYYVSKDGYELWKIMPPLPNKEEERYIGIQKGRTVTVCNDIKEYDGNIDYDFYIKEARKLVDPLLTKKE